MARIVIFERDPPSGHRIALSRQIACPKRADVDLIRRPLAMTKSENLNI